MKKGLSLFVANAIVVGNIGSSISISYADENNVSRISGKDRYDTALKISQKYFPNTKKIILVSGEEYIDSS